MLRDVQFPLLLLTQTHTLTNAVVEDTLHATISISEYAVHYSRLSFVVSAGQSATTSTVEMLLICMHRISVSKFPNRRPNKSFKLRTLDNRRNCCIVSVCVMRYELKHFFSNSIYIFIEIITIENYGNNNNATLRREGILKWNERMVKQIMRSFSSWACN